MLEYIEYNLDDKEYYHVIVYDDDNIIEKTKITAYCDIWMVDFWNE